MNTSAKKLSIIFIILSLTEIHFIDCEKIKKGLLSAFSVVKVVPISLYKNTTFGTYNPKTTYYTNMLKEIFFSVSKYTMWWQCWFQGMIWLLFNQPTTIKYI